MLGLSIFGGIELGNGLVLEDELGLVKDFFDFFYELKGFW